MPRRRSKRELAAIFSSLGGGGRPQSVRARELGSVFGRRSGKTLVATSPSIRDQRLLEAAKGRLLDRRAQKIIARGDREERRRGEARRFLLKAAGAGAGLALAGGAAAFARSPRLQLALGRRLTQTRRVLPLRTLKNIAENVGAKYVTRRDETIGRIGSFATRGVRFLERKATGVGDGHLPYGPAGGARYFKKPKLAPSVQEIAPHRRTVAEQRTQEWMADQAASDVSHDIRRYRTGVVVRQKAGTAAARQHRQRYGLIGPDPEVDVIERAKRGWIDHADIRLKKLFATPLASRLFGMGHKVRNPLTGKSEWVVDFDPEHTVKHGRRPGQVAESLFFGRWGRPESNVPRPGRHTKAKFTNTRYQRR